MEHSEPPHQQFESDQPTLDHMQARRPQIPSDAPSYPQSPEGEQAQKFTDDEVQNLREIFDLFDKEKSGEISAKDLETIMGSLQRNPAEVQDFVEQLGDVITFS